MAAAPTTNHNALSKAAQDTDIPDVTDNACWPVLKIFLKGQGVDTAARSEADWKKAFNKHRRLWYKELGKEKEKVEVQSPSMESQQKSEPVSLPDSAYQSESPQDHGERQPLMPYYLHAVVQPSDEHPKGLVFVAGCYSDDTDEDYIIETVYDRLKIPKGKGGKVSVTYIPHDSKTMRRSSFAVREDEDGQADMVFTTKQPAQKAKPSQSQQHSEDRVVPDLRRSKDASERLQQHIEDLSIKAIIENLWSEKSDEETFNLGRRYKLFIQGTQTVKEEHMGLGTDNDCDHVDKG